ncbi:hypothetical protein BaRGS_00019151 [Batillaria attramentaria]|uniref:Uncharacterized protein n=1 Tax=Batillaria attramentaria TaxID=370345 RepID=A0ABD0KQQ0_9CAEN
MSPILRAVGAGVWGQGLAVMEIDPRYNTRAEDVFQTTAVSCCIPSIDLFLFGGCKRLVERLSQADGNTGSDGRALKSLAINISVECREWPRYNRW